MSDERDMDPTMASHPKTTIIGEVDPLSFCPQCGKDDRVRVSRPPTGGITFDDTKEKVAGYVCSRCRTMWTERAPSGREVRADMGGPRGTTISVPGRPTRPRIIERKPSDPRNLDAVRSIDQLAGLMEPDLLRRLRKPEYRDPLKDKRRRGH